MIGLGPDSIGEEPGNPNDCCCETLPGSDITPEMVWTNFGTPLPVEVTRENSSISEYEMHPAFLEVRPCGQSLHLGDSPDAGKCDSKLTSMAEVSSGSRPDGG